MSTAGEFEPADHVTEREAGPWRDCTFASMLETLRLGFVDGEEIPPTIAEKEAYRAAANLPDDHPGANIPTAVDAAEERYRLDGGYEITADWGLVRAALATPGRVLVVTGSMGSVPAWLRRWSPSFTGAHAVAARGGGVLGATWCDPLAPKGNYVGEYVAMTTWQAFFTGLPGAQAFITSVGKLTRYGMAGDYVIYEDDRSGQLAAGVEFFNDWELTDRRGTVSNGGRVQLRGYRGEAYAVKVRTGQGYVDQKARPTNVFVAKTKLTDIQVTPPPPPDTTHRVALTVDGAVAWEGDV